jgi:predicted dehydrogenase
VTRPVRAGLVGAGRIVREGHVPAYLANHDILAVTAVADPDARAVAAVAGALGVPPGRRYPGLAPLLDASDLDLVVIASPPRYHHEAVTSALARGLGVICEKPLCLSVAELQAIKAAAGGQGFVAVMHNYLARPGWRHLLSLVRSGAIGTPVIARFEELSGDRWRRPGDAAASWRESAGQGGGPLTDNLYHSLYLSEQILGSPLRAACGHQAALRHSYPAGDIAMVTVRHDNGSLTQATGSWCYQGWSRAIAEVHGHKAVLRYRYWGEPGRLWLDEAGTETEIAVPGWDDELESGYTVSFREIVTQFRSGGPPPSGIEDAARILNVVNQVPPVPPAPAA